MKIVLHIQIFAFAAFASLLTALVGLYSEQEAALLWAGWLFAAGALALCAPAIKNACYIITPYVNVAILELAKSMYKLLFFVVGLSRHINLKHTDRRPDVYKLVMAPETDSCTKIVGESFYVDTIRKIHDKLNGSKTRSEVATQAVLMPEPQNPHDANAVGIYVLNAKVGHLDWETAALYQEDLVILHEQQGLFVCCAAVVYHNRLRGESAIGSVRLYMDLEDIGDLLLRHSNN